MATYLGTTINESPTIVVTAGADIKAAQGKAVMLWSVDTVAKYNDCKAKHGAIVKALT